ncbi:MAG: TRAP transporter large permease [Otoolea sp.]
MIAMVSVIVLLVIIGVPMAFSLLAGSLFYIMISDMSISIVIQKLVMTLGGSFSMLAVPFFVLAGNIMNSTGVTERIFRFAKAMVGHIPGGLGHVNVFASVVFAGMSGSAIADTAGLGKIELQAMKEEGYDDDFSVAITGVSSCLGPIIPPSVGMVIYAMLAGVSPGRILMAGIVPGILMALTMCVIVYVIAKKRNYPVTPKASWKERVEAFVRAVPALCSPLLLLSGILFGIFTPTEAAVVCTIYSLLLGVVYRQIHFKDIPGLLLDSLRSTTMITTLICASMVLGVILNYNQIPQMITTFLMTTVESKVGLMLIIMAILLFVGLFFDSIAAIVLVVPIMLPMIETMGLDLVQFGVISTLLVVLGLLTPPVGNVLYILSDFSGMSIGRIFKSMFPYIAGLLFLDILLFMVPEITLFLPNLVFGT